MNCFTCQSSHNHTLDKYRPEDNLRSQPALQGFHGPLAMQQPVQKQPVSAEQISRAPPHARIGVHTYEKVTDSPRPKAKGAGGLQLCPRISPAMRCPAEPADSRQDVPDVIKGCAEMYHRKRLNSGRSSTPNTSTPTKPVSNTSYNLTGRTSSSSAPSPRRTPQKTPQKAPQKTPKKSLSAKKLTPSSEIWADTGGYIWNPEQVPTMAQRTLSFRCFNPHMYNSPIGPHHQPITRHDSYSAASSVVSESPSMDPFHAPPLHYDPPLPRHLPAARQRRWHPDGGGLAYSSDSDTRRLKPRTRQLSFERPQTSCSSKIKGDSTIREEVEEEEIDVFSDSLDRALNQEASPKLKSNFSVSQHSAFTRVASRDDMEDTKGSLLQSAKRAQSCRSEGGRSMTAAEFKVWREKRKKCFQSLKEMQLSGNHFTYTFGPNDSSDTSNSVTPQNVAPHSQILDTKSPHQQQKQQQQPPQPDLSPQNEYDAEVAAVLTYGQYSCAKSSSLAGQPHPAKHKQGAGNKEMKLPSHEWLMQYYPDYPSSFQNYPQTPQFLCKRHRHGSTRTVNGTSSSEKPVTLAPKYRNAREMAMSDSEALVSDRHSESSARRVRGRTDPERIQRLRQNLNKHNAITPDVPSNTPVAPHRIKSQSKPKSSYYINGSEIGIKDENGNDTLTRNSVSKAPEKGETDKESCLPQYDLQTASIVTDDLAGLTSQMTCQNDTRLEENTEQLMQHIDKHFNLPPPPDGVNKGLNKFDNLEAYVVQQKKDDMMISVVTDDLLDSMETLYRFSLMD